MEASISISPCFVILIAPTSPASLLFSLFFVVFLHNFYNIYYTKFSPIVGQYDIGRGSVIWPVNWMYTLST